MTATGNPVSYAAPGRINLIGEHTDYNLGLALPIAIPQRTVVTFAPDGGDTIEVRSDREPDPVSVRLDTEPRGTSGWASYVAGVVWALHGAGHHVSGGRMSITSDVESGSGLASSAALECAVLGALAGAAKIRLGRTEQALIAQRAENEYVGAPTGLMDQLAALHGQPRRAMLIDFRDITVEQVAFDPEAVGATLLLINSRATHQHAGGEYAARRASCERVAAALGVSTLRELQHAGTSALSAVPDPIDVRRARHIITENQRVLDFVAALNVSDTQAAGQLLTASHTSMRDDFAITTAHIDLIADAAVTAGALGARMTGGGFGGCVIALVATDRAGIVCESVRRAVRAAGLVEPAITATHAGPGAGPVVGARQTSR